MLKKIGERDLTQYFINFRGGECSVFNKNKIYNLLIHPVVYGDG